MNKSDPDDDCDSSCSFSRLPDDIVLKIFNRLFDPETLCFCKLVSKRFYSIVVQVDNISYTTINNNGPSRKSIHRFTRLKSLYVEKGGEDNGYLFKWKIRLTNSFDRFMLLSPSLIFDKSNGVYVTGKESQEMNYRTLIRSSADASWRLMMMFSDIISLPLLEKITYADSCKRGTICLSGEKIAQVRNLLNSPSDETVSQKVIRITMSPDHKHIQLSIPLLDLPVSGYVMKGISLYLMESGDLRDDENDSFIMINDLEDREEAAYSEAMKKIWKMYKEDRIAYDDAL